MSEYSLYGTKLIANDNTLKDFTISLVNNVPKTTDDKDEFLDSIRENLVDDVGRTDIDYENLLYRYRDEIGNLLYEIDNHGHVIPTITFFGEEAKETFNELVMAYAELIIL